MVDGDRIDDGKLNNNNGVGSVSATRGLHNFWRVRFCQYTPPYLLLSVYFAYTGLSHV